MEQHIFSYSFELFAVTERGEHSENPIRQIKGRQHLQIMGQATPPNRGADNSSLLFFILFLDRDCIIHTKFYYLKSYHLYNVFINSYHYLKILCYCANRMQYKGPICKMSYAYNMFICYWVSNIHCTMVLVFSEIMVNRHMLYFHWMPIAWYIRLCIRLEP
jgi:hypothetical protein